MTPHYNSTKEPTQCRLNIGKAIVDCFEKPDLVFKYSEIKITSSIYRRKQTEIDIKLHFVSKSFFTSFPMAINLVLPNIFAFVELAELVGTRKLDYLKASVNHCMTFWIAEIRYFVKLLLILTDKRRPLSERISNS